MSRYAILGDCHAPAMLEEYPNFVLDICEQWGVPSDNIYHIGDVVDFHALSRWDSELGHQDVMAEYDAAMEQVQVLYEAFPTLKILTGNHDEIPQRQAKSLNLPPQFMKDHNKIWETPDWHWFPRYHKEYIEEGNFQIAHGDGLPGGKTPSLRAAEQDWCCTVSGHIHTAAGAWFGCNDSARYWGMNVGTGIDHSHPCFNYSRTTAKKPMIGMGLVIDGTPIFEPMAKFNKFGRRVA